MSKLLPYETIVKAQAGEPEAVEAVLSHYAGYIRFLSKLYGSYNADIEDYIKTKLIEGQLKFRLDYPQDLSKSRIPAAHHNGTHEQ